MQPKSPSRSVRLCPNSREDRKFFGQTRDSDSAPSLIHGVGGPLSFPYPASQSRAQPESEKNPAPNAPRRGAVVRNGYRRSARVSLRSVCLCAFQKRRCARCLRRCFHHSGDAESTPGFHHGESGPDPLLHRGHGGSNLQNLIGVGRTARDPGQPETLRLPSASITARLVSLLPSM
jgi:hypothetical protein